MNDDVAAAVSNPDSPGYSPDHHDYLPTTDPASPYYMPPSPPRGSPEAIEEKRRVIASMGKALDGADRHIAEVLGRAGTDQGWDIDFYNEFGPPRTSWELIDHPTMTRAITSNADAPAVHEQAREWSKVGECLPGLVQAVEKGVAQGGWQGSAATSAEQQFGWIARWIADVARGALSAGQQQAERAAVLGETQRQMAAVPPVEFDHRAADARLQQMTDLGEITRQVEHDDTMLQKQREAHARAADLMNHFDRTVASSGRAPLFPPPPFSMEAPEAVGNQPGTSATATPAPAPAAGAPKHGPGRAPAPRTSSPAPIPPSAVAPVPDGPPTAKPSPAAEPPPRARHRPSDGTIAAAAGPTPPNPPTGDSPRLGGDRAGASPPLAGGQTASSIPAPGTFRPEHGAVSGKATGTGTGLPGRRSGSLLPGTPSGSTPGAARPAMVGRDPHPNTAPLTGASRRKEDDERRPPSPYTDLDTPTIFETDERTAPPTIGVHDQR